MSRNPSGKYRKVSTRIWSDARFLNLSLNARLAFLHLLTHPHMLSIGAMRGNAGGLACEIGLDFEKYGTALDEIETSSMAEIDHAMGLIWIPKFLRHNRPESPNVIRSWGRFFPDLPEGDLFFSMLDETARMVQEMGDPFLDAFRDACIEGLSDGTVERLSERLSGRLPERLTERKRQSFPKGNRDPSLNLRAQNSELRTRNSEEEKGAAAASLPPGGGAPGCDDSESDLFSENPARNGESADTRKKTGALEAEVMGAWTAMAETAGLPAVRELTKARRKAIRERLKNPAWREGWRQAIEAIPGIPFLCGENKRGWRISFDFFLKPDSLNKICEGQYGNGKRDLAVPMEHDPDDPFTPSNAIKKGTKK